jgi:hypothetical protein
MRRRVLKSGIGLGVVVTGCGIVWACSSDPNAPNPGGVSGSGPATGGSPGTGGTPGQTAGTGPAAAGTGTATAGTSSTAGTGGAGTAGTVGAGGTTGGGDVGGAGGSTGGGGTVAPACKPTTGLNGAGITVSATDISAFKYVPPVTGSPMTKMAYDPVGKVVVILQQNGTLTAFDPNVALPTTAATATVTTTMAYNSGYQGNGDHRGIVFDKDGNLYVMAANNGGVTIKKGAVAAGGGARTWTNLVTTSKGYSNGASANYNHSFSGIAVSADGKSLYFSSGSRTEHGEDEGPSGIAGNNREVPLTSCVLKVPTDTPTDLQNDDAALMPFMFADGTRNAFDMAFNANGDLIGTENGPDMDLPDEINWLQQGKHYGFPWRFGDVDNPVTVQGFTKETDKRIRQVYGGYNTYAFDGAFPAKPAGVTFTDPIQNMGPEANFLVASKDAAAPTKAGAEGLAGVTAHRSPLGIAFDTEGALCGEYYKQGFVLSYGPIPGGSIGDTGEDLLLITLTKNGDKYSMTTKSLAKGIKAPMDSVLVGNRLFTIGYGGTAQVYVFALPTP